LLDVNNDIIEEPAVRSFLAFEGYDREALRARPWHSAQQMHREGAHDLFFDREALADGIFDRGGHELDAWAANRAGANRN
jgi:hypothetical protein